MPLEDHPTDPDKMVYKPRQYQLDCPNCEYHKNRAARWRAEAYKQAGHDVIELPWVGLTDEERDDIILNSTSKNKVAAKVEAKLKEKNT
jgi:hypothetical protein